ncbi:MAG: hypothetical protein H7318_07615 [Oligoflexus sp.]|nr:hypothetical protein [Oligoflexus sp.]
MQIDFKSTVISCLSLFVLMIPQNLLAYSANKVWMEHLDDGRYRVGIQYTVPALKEFRLAHAIFNKKKDADLFYFQVLRGADFSVNGTDKVWFTPPKTKPEPW